MSTPEAQKFENLIRALNEVLSRQNRIEERLSRLERTLYPEATKPESEEAIAAPVVDPVNATVPEVEQSPLPLQEPALESKVGLTIINRVGVVTLVLGVAFFFKWAVDNNWIGPTGRVALGLLAGFASLWAADVFWRKGQQTFAQGITGAGIAILYLSFYAAFDFYHLIPQIVAFLLLLATTILAATLALRYNAIAIAALGFFGAYIIPLLLSNGEDRPWFLISYLLLLNFAATELAKRRQWAFLEVLSFSATVLIFGGWIWQVRKPDDKVVGTIGVLALCAQRTRTSLPLLFLISQALCSLALLVLSGHGADHPFTSVLILLVAMGGLAFSHYRRYQAIIPTAFGAFWVAAAWNASGSSAFLPIGTAGFLLFTAWTWWRFAILKETLKAIGFSVFTLNGLIYYLFAYLVLLGNVPSNFPFRQWFGPLALAVGAAYLVFGLLLRRKKLPLHQDLVRLSMGLAAAFLTLAIPIQLAGFSIAIAWSIQAAALIWIGLRVNSVKTMLGGLIVFALAILHVAAIDSLVYPSAFTYSFLLNTRFLVFAVLAVSLLCSAYWSAKVDRNLALVTFCAGHLTMLTGLSMEVVGLAARSSQQNNRLSRETIGITILFALYAVMLVSVGVARRSAVHRLAGLALTAIVIVKLYLYDVWQLGRVYQIVAFVLLGILLLSTSFLYSRFKGFIQEWKRDDQ